VSLEGAGRGRPSALGVACKYLRGTRDLVAGHESTSGAANLRGSRTYAGLRMSRSDGRVDAVAPGFRATHIAEERPGFAGQGDG